MHVLSSCDITDITWNDPSRTGKRLLLRSHPNNIYANRDVKRMDIIRVKWTANSIRMSVDVVNIL